MPFSRFPDMFREVCSTLLVIFPISASFSKIPLGCDVLFHAFGHVLCCVFENVRVIPHICVYVCRTAVQTCVRTSEKQVFLKYLRRATLLSMCSDMFLVVCSSMSVFFPTFAYMSAGKHREHVCANI